MPKDERAIAGYMILWNGVVTDIGALDGTIGQSLVDAGLYSNRRAARKAIQAKIRSYEAYARIYPHQRWPSPNEEDFQIVTLRQV